VVREACRAARELVAEAGPIEREADSTAVSHAVTAAKVGLGELVRQAIRRR